MERAEGGVLVPSTVRSHFEGKTMDDPPTFEKTYPKYEFSELVRMAIAAGAWISGIRRRAEARRPDAPPTPAAGSELRAD
jgi:hypothetical protein